MTDPSDRIDALKIDREAATAASGSRLWLLIPAVIIVLLLGWWFVLRPQMGSVLVETDTARRPPSIAAASSVLADPAGGDFSEETSDETDRLAQDGRPRLIGLSALDIRV